MPTISVGNSLDSDSDCDCDSDWFRSFDSDSSLLDVDVMNSVDWEGVEVVCCRFSACVVVSFSFSVVVNVVVVVDSDSASVVVVVDSDSASVVVVVVVVETSPAFCRESVSTTERCKRLFE